MIQTNTQSGTPPPNRIAVPITSPVKRSDSAPDDIRVSSQVRFSIDHLLCPALSGSTAALLFEAGQCEVGGWVGRIKVVDSKSGRGST